jgi:hypothetical protein
MTFAIDLLHLKEVMRQKMLWTGLLDNQLINVLIKSKDDTIQ